MPNYRISSNPPCVRHGDSESLRDAAEGLRGDALPVVWSEVFVSSFAVSEVPLWTTTPRIRVSEINKKTACRFQDAPHFIKYLHQVVKIKMQVGLKPEGTAPGTATAAETNLNNPAIMNSPLI